MIGLIDYGAGNLFSVRNALDRLGRESRLVASPAEFEGVDRIVLPGVGHFGAASDRLRASGIFDALKNWADADRPLLGICLGMQLLFEGSEEDGGRSPGLGVFRGRVVELHGPRRLHMGWNTLIPTAAAVSPSLGRLVKDGEAPALAVLMDKANEGGPAQRSTSAGLAHECTPKVNGESKARPSAPSGSVVPEGYYYFVHGFAPRDENAEDVLGKTRFGETVFSAAVGRGSILGLQFHPEKSGKIGLDLMARWADGKMDGPKSRPEGRLPPNSSVAMRRWKRGNEDRRSPQRGSIEEKMDPRPAVRIIPCLDMDDGRVVKGVRFKNLRDAGDPAELARDYNDQGADELCFLDVGASWKSRKTLLEVVRRVSREVFIPLTVGGGLCSIEDIREALSAGADKVSLCTAAVENPDLLTAAAERFGRQCLVLSLDAKAKDGGWTVTTHGGRRDRNLDAVAWAARTEALGAGEILLNSVDRDGTGAGYDLELLRRIRAAVRIPVIASGGGDKPAHIWEAVSQGEADAVLLASALHSGRRTVAEYKNFLREKGARLR